MESPPPQENSEMINQDPLQHSKTSNGGESSALIPLTDVERDENNSPSSGGEDSGGQGFLNTLNALLIALVVVIGALAAWRASVAADAAGDADYFGLRALVNSEETQALNHLTAYRSYADYLDYWSSKRQGELLEEEMKQKPALAEDDQFVAQVKSAYDLADASYVNLEQRFLNRDGSYNVQRQLGQLWADAMKEKDLKYDVQFAEAERMRNKTIYLLMCVMILSIAPVFYSLVETVGERTRRTMLIIGSLFMVTGTLFLLLVEFEKIPF